MLTQHRSQLTKRKTLRLLDELESAEDGAAKSLYIPSGQHRSDIHSSITSNIEDAPADAIDTIAKSKTGAVLFWGKEHKCLILPPFPLKESHTSAGYDIAPLRSFLTQELKVALLLVRLGEYAVGVFDGENLVSSKVGTGLVHSREKKGGTSQRRFQRHREKQMEYFFERVCGHAREHLEPQLRQLDHLLYGGERSTILSFRKQCSFLQKFDDRTLDWLLDVRHPKQATLKQAIIQAWSSTVTQWEEN
ncbi:MAG: Vms1/Ankzf1 family peptidyl-tRNA hydrolase [Dehalococcoidia bacterium]